MPRKMLINMEKDWILEKGLRVDLCQITIMFGSHIRGYIGFVFTMFGLMINSSSFLVKFKRENERFRTVLYMNYNSP